MNPVLKNIAELTMLIIFAPDIDTESKYQYSEYLCLSLGLFDSEIF